MDISLLVAVAFSFILDNSGYTTESVSMPEVQVLETDAFSKQCANRHRDTKVVACYSSLKQIVYVRETMPVSVQKMNMYQREKYVVSVLVHEIYHHVQNTADATPIYLLECPLSVETGAYAMQNKYLSSVNMKRVKKQHIKRVSKCPKSYVNKNIAIFNGE
jgi:hypothetical protein